MSIKINYIEQETSKVFGFPIKFAESIVLHKEEVCPFPIEEKLYDELFKTNIVTSLAASDDEDNMYMAVTSEKSDWVLCIKQDSEGEFEILGKVEL